MPASYYYVMYVGYVIHLDFSIAHVDSTESTFCDVNTVLIVKTL